MRKPIHFTFAALAVGLASPALAAEADWQQVEKALGVSGVMEPETPSAFSTCCQSASAASAGLARTIASAAKVRWMAFRMALPRTLVGFRGASIARATHRQSHS